MFLLDYLLPQPPFELAPAQQEEFDSLLAATPPGGWIDYRLAAPKWQFLSYLCQSMELVLHGSQNLTISEIEPRKALDVRAFSAQEAIYATIDGIWVIYFAIVDRQNFMLSLFNSCLNVCLAPTKSSAHSISFPLRIRRWRKIPGARARFTSCRVNISARSLLKPCWGRNHLPAALGQRPGCQTGCQTVGGAAGFPIPLLGSRPQ